MQDCGGMTMKNTYRFPSPIVNADGQVIYGLFENEAVKNPDFKWPARLQRPDDVWVDEETDQIATPDTN